MIVPLSIEISFHFSSVLNSGAAPTGYFRTRGRRAVLGVLPVKKAVPIWDPSVLHFGYRSLGTRLSRILSLTVSIS